MDNVTLITGGTSGIGRAIAEKAVSESDDRDIIMVVYGHDDKVAYDFLDSFPFEQRKRIALFKADLSDYDEMMRLTAEIKDFTGHIDRIVMNTGIGTYVPFEEYTCELWDRVMRTNVNIPAMMIKELKPVIAEHGSIVFMGSHAGQVPYSSSIVYGVSKAAVLFLAKSLVKCFEGMDVSVNAIAPGFIETRWQDGRTDESRERVNRKIAAHRFGTPEEVAELCFFILNSDYINGSVYDIHGGYDYF